MNDEDLKRMCNAVMGTNDPHLAEYQIARELKRLIVAKQERLRADCAGESESIRDLVIDGKIDQAVDQSINFRKQGENWMTEEQGNYEAKQWAIVALFGHTKIAGQVSSYNFGGQFVRIDIPPIDGRPGFTKLIGPTAIFDITFVTEEVARAAAKHFRAEPVSAYEIPELRQLRLGGGGDFEPEEGGD